MIEVSSVAEFRTAIRIILVQSIRNLEFSAQIINIFCFGEDLLNFSRFLILGTLQSLMQLRTHFHYGLIKFSNLSIFLLCQEPDVILLSFQLLTAHSEILLHHL